MNPGSEYYKSTSYAIFSAINGERFARVPTSSVLGEYLRESERETERDTHIQRKTGRQRHRETKT